MDLKERLKMLDKGHPAKGAPRETGAVVENRGSYTVIEERQPLSDVHGCVPLLGLADVEPSSLVYAGKDRSLETFEPERTIFLDLETTGLSGGAGIYAFMAGMVFLSGDSLILRQYLLENLDDEARMLRDICDYLSPFRGVVTYNGKSFDMPLLKMRFLFQGIHWKWDIDYHLDLLHTVRRLWRMNLSSCQLKEVERRLLGLERVGDVDGCEIPSIYFHYLRTGRKELLEPVLIHNALDVKSLVALTVRAARAIEETIDGRSEGPYENLAVGRILDDMKDHGKAARHLKAALCGLRGAHLYTAMRRLSLIQKRRGDWPSAERTWLDMIKKFPDESFAYIELAKFYEHRRKDLQEAEAIVAVALERFNHSLSVVLNDFKHRHRRILRKNKKGKA